MSLEDLAEVWQELDDRESGYQRAEDYARGDVTEVFANRTVQRRLERAAERYRFNLAKTPIKALASKIKLTSVQVVDSDRDTLTLSEVWDANDMDVYMPLAIERAMTFGDYYIMVWPTQERAPVDPENGLADDALVRTGVEIVLQDPRRCIVLYDPENERRKRVAGKRWTYNTMIGRGWRLDLYYPDIIEQWVCHPNTDPGRIENWEPVLDTGGSLPNDTGEIPFFHLRTDIPYGRPVHEDIYGCQDALNKLLITLLSNTDYYGHPLRWALVDPAGELDSSRDGPDYDDDLDADAVPNLRGGTESALRQGPGGFLELVGMKEVGQFDPASPDHFIDPTTLFLKLMAQIGGVPFHYFDPSGETPSGESLKVADAPLTDAARWLQKILQGPISELWVFALRLVGVTVDAVEPRWAPVEVAVGLSDWQTVGEKMKSGVPQSVALSEAGYDADTVATWLDTEADAMALANRVALLTQIGDAIQRIGSGIALGVIGEEEAARVISQVVGQAAPPDGGESA